MKTKNTAYFRIARTVCIAVISATIALLFFAIGCGSPTTAVDDVASEVFALDTETYYDGRGHGIKIENLRETDITEFSADGIVWRDTGIEYTLPGRYTVYYRVTRNGTIVKSSSATIDIYKAILVGIDIRSVTAVYDGKRHGIKIDGAGNGDTIVYSLDGENFSDINGAIEVGKYTVYCRVERGYAEYRDSAELVILPDISGVYVNLEKGEIVLGTAVATINGTQSTLSYDVTGAGKIGENDFKTEGSSLVYGGDVYTKKASAERVYKIHINDTKTIYVLGGQKITLCIAPDGNDIVVSYDGRQIATVPDANYCENATRIDYDDMTFELDVDSEEFTIEISNRPQRASIDGLEKSVLYDGEAHGFFDLGGMVMYKVGDTYTRTSPTHTDAGEYTADVIITENGYLPQKATLRLIVQPNLGGVYFSTDKIIAITGNKIKINGVQSDMVYADGGWTVAGDIAEKTETGIRIGAVEYTKTNKAILVKLGDELKVITKAIETIEIKITDGKISVTTGGKEIMSVEHSGQITVTQDGKEVKAVRADWYVIGQNELRFDYTVIIVSLK